jgi:hypothetical protein
VTREELVADLKQWRNQHDAEALADALEAAYQAGLDHGADDLFFNKAAANAAFAKRLGGTDE